MAAFEILSLLAEEPLTFLRWLHESSKTLLYGAASAGRMRGAQSQGHSGTASDDGEDRGGVVWRLADGM